MLSGAPLLLLIVVGWAAVLVPMLLRRHDVSVESRSADRFATAMRILSRRSAPTTDRRYIVVPRPSVPLTRRTPAASVASRSAAARGGTAAQRARPPSTGRASLAARRRRVLLGLVTIAFGGLVGALLVAPVWWSVQAAADLLIAAFVVHLRREAIRARARSRAALRRRVPVPVAAVDERPAQAGPVTAGPVAAAPGAAAPASAGPESARTVELTSYTRDGGWQPVPVPVPTYVTAPRAPAPEQPAPASVPAKPAATSQGPRQPRIVDLTRPGAWSAAELGIDLTDTDDGFELLAAEDHALDDILESRRAVND